MDPHGSVHIALVPNSELYLGKGLSLLSDHHQMRHHRLPITHINMSSRVLSSLPCALSLFPTSTITAHPPDVSVICVIRMCEWTHSRDVTLVSHSPNIAILGWPQIVGSPAKFNVQDQKFRSLSTKRPIFVEIL